MMPSNETKVIDHDNDDKITVDDEQQEDNVDGMYILYCILCNIH